MDVIPWDRSRAIRAIHAPAPAPRSCSLLCSALLCSAALAMARLGSGSSSSSSSGVCCPQVDVSC
ncbi:hypothetical protein KC19_4G196000 [Ceratodon purpureus]|uniref:Uncharacterized protein n=1 Tax=Ceratodon purpureus TaxID=3225 RepID=A0A8T0ICX8_CERPU|nr:hypothetical protein KC19_4G196000 [Ceratodon purpureus]